MHESDYLRFNPESGFDPELSEDNGSYIGPALTRLDRNIKRLLQEHNDGEYLTKEQEWDLAVLIEASRQAKKRLQDGKRLWDSTVTELQQTIAAGEEAKRKLVECNLAFAAYLARMSVGMPMGETGETARNRPSPYRNLIGLASRHAEFDDRIQVAFAAMVYSADSFKPLRDKDGHPAPVKFITYAGLKIRQELVQSRRLRESNGIHLSQSVTEDLGKLRIQPSSFTEEETARLQLLEEQSYALYLEELDLELAAPEEQEEDDAPLPELMLSDVLATDRNNAPYAEAQATSLRKAIEVALETLSEREAGTMRLRYGLSDGFMHTLDEIGMVYGVSRERVRQIESKTLTKLRHPTRSKPLGYYLGEDWDEEGRGYTLEQAYDAPHLRTRQQLGILALEEEQRAKEAPQDRVRAAGQESWQAFPEEEWDAPMRITAAERYRQLEAAEKRFRTFMFEELVRPHIRLFTTEGYRRYSREFRVYIRETFGDEFGLRQLENFWNEHLERYIDRAKIKAGEGFDLNCVGRFVSSLLAEYMESDSKVELTIPKAYSGRLGYLGEGLQTGELVLHGDVGDLAGLGMKGQATLTIFGSAGARLANDLQDHAAVQIRGDVGDYAGLNMRQNSHLMVMGSAGKYLASHVGSPQVTVQILGNAEEGLGYGSTHGTIEVEGTVRSVAITPEFKGTLQAGRVGSIKFTKA